MTSRENNPQAVLTNFMTVVADMRACAGKAIVNRDLNVLNAQCTPIKYRTFILILLKVLLLHVDLATQLRPRNRCCSINRYRYKEAPDGCRLLLIIDHAIGTDLCQFTSREIMFHLAERALRIF